MEDYINNGSNKLIQHGRDKSKKTRSYFVQPLRGKTPLCIENAFNVLLKVIGEVRKSNLFAALVGTPSVKRLGVLGDPKM